MVSSSPLTRSSYHASEDFKKLKKSREDQFSTLIKMKESNKELIINHKAIDLFVFYCFEI